jgi:hypothetical protein
MLKPTVGFRFGAHIDQQTFRMLEARLELASSSQHRALGRYVFIPKGWEGFNSHSIETNRNRNGVLNRPTSLYYLPKIPITTVH